MIIVKPRGSEDQFLYVCVFVSIGWACVHMCVVCAHMCLYVGVRGQFWGSFFRDNHPYFLTYI